jgi:hypothetical protein
METLKGIGGFLVAAAFFLGGCLLFLWAMNGLVWVAVNGLPLLNKLGAIVFFLCLIVVPLSFLAGSVNTPALSF